MDEVEKIFFPISESLGPEGVRDGWLYLKMWKKSKSLHPKLWTVGMIKRLDPLANIQIHLLLQCKDRSFETLTLQPQDQWIKKRYYIKR